MKKQMKYIKGLIILLAASLLLLAAAGCRTQEPGGESIETITQAAPGPSPVFTPADTPAGPAPTTTAPIPTVGILVPTATLDMVDPVCVPLRTQEELPPRSYREMPAAVLDFLNRGGTLEELDEGLYESGIANQPVAAATGDLTGNGKLDVVISIYNPVSASIPPAGRLVIYTCQDGRYELTHSEDSPEFVGAPGIHALQDLTGDGRQELVINFPACGAHTCFEAIQILSWDSTGFTNRLVGDTDDLPYPFLELEEQADGTYDLVITGSGIGSAGAGPQRSLIRRWSYQPGRELWVVVEDKLGESNYRIHLLHDADEASAAGEYDRALLLYQRVISDTTLDDWIDPVQERETLAAYARFRLVVLYQLRGQEQFSRMILREMEQAHPAASPQHVYARMARTFSETYVSGGVEAACREVRNYAEINEEDVLTPLGPEEFGYGNPSYAPEDVCPW
jgi:hypothetical protein